MKKNFDTWGRFYCNSPYLTIYQNFNICLQKTDVVQHGIRHKNTRVCFRYPG